MVKDTIFLQKIHKKIRVKDMLKILNVEETDIVYLGGSLIEGQINYASRRLGNEYSDLDIVIIRSYNDIEYGNTVSTKEKEERLFASYQGVGCDVEIYDRRMIEEILEAIADNNVNNSKGFPDMSILPPGWTIGRINNFLTRFMYGIPIYNDFGYYILRKSFSVKSFLNIMMRYHLQNLENIVEDVLGNMLQGELETSLLLCRYAGYQMIEFILAYEGIMNNRVKWAWIKMDNLVRDKIHYAEIYNIIKRINFADLRDSMEKDMQLFLEAIEKIIHSILETEVKSDETGEDKSNFMGHRRNLAEF